MSSIYYFVFLFVLYIPSILSADTDCRFAPTFSKDDLFKNKGTQQLFLDHVMYFDGFFHQHGIGINEKSGLTYDGCPLDETTGLKTDGLHTFSASSKESLHLNILTLALNKNALALKWAYPNATSTEMAVQRIIRILSNKIKSYEDFNSKYPGFGGFLPWYSADDNGMKPSWDWQDRVPSLDNGQLFWAVYALKHVLENQGYAALANKYDNFLSTMIKNAKSVFWSGPGKLLKF
jgi:hypothetical protein